MLNNLKRKTQQTRADRNDYSYQKYTSEQSKVDYKQHRQSKIIGRNGRNIDYVEQKK